MQLGAERIPSCREPSPVRETESDLLEDTLVGSKAYKCELIWLRTQQFVRWVGVLT